MSDNAQILAAPPADLCLEFANTLTWRGSAEPAETLRTPADLAAWCGATGGVPAALARQLAAQWRPAQATAALRQALAWREAIYAVFAATAEGATPADEALTRLNAGIAAAPARRGIVAADGGFAWQVEPLRARPGHLLAPVLWSAADLLVGARLVRVKLCANPQCRWVFLDESRAGTRRWCDMSSCGNRAKAHRHYQRKRKG